MLSEKDFKCNKKRMILEDSYLKKCIYKFINAGYRIVDIVDFLIYDIDIDVNTVADVIKKDKKLKLSFYKELRNDRSIYFEQEVEVDGRKVKKMKLPEQFSLLDF